jgi:hypothetical protein
LIDRIVERDDFRTRVLETATVFDKRYPVLSAAAFFPAV